MATILKMMPAKSISWKWPGGYTEHTAPHAVVRYNGYEQGRLALRPDGLWEGHLAWRDVEVTTLDGYDTMRDCANMLFRKFQRAAREAGYTWPY